MKKVQLLVWSIVVVYLLVSLLARPSDTRPTASFTDRSSAHAAMTGGFSRRAAGRHRRSTDSVVELNSKTGYRLAIDPQGQVYSSSSNSDPNTELLRESRDLMVVSLKGLSSGRYLAYNAQGTLITTPTCSGINEFNETRVTHRRGTYFTYRYRNTNNNTNTTQDWYIGINRHGHIMRGAHYDNSPRNRELFTTIVKREG